MAESKNQEQNTIRLSDDTGFEMDFMVIETIIYEFEQYDVLMPIKKSDDLVENRSVLILKKEVGIGSGQSDYSIVEDPYTLEALFEEFKKIQKQREEEEE